LLPHKEAMWQTSSTIKDFFKITKNFTKHIKYKTNLSTMAAGAASGGFRFTGTDQYASKAHIVFSSKNAPTGDVRERLAEAVMEGERVRGVGWQKIIFGEKWHLAIVLMAKKRFGKVVIENALSECGLEDEVKGYGLIELTTGAAFTRLKRIKGDISTIKPGPRKAAQPDHDSSASEDTEPRKRKAPAHKGQPRKRSGAAAAAAAVADDNSDSDSDGENGNDSEGFTGGKLYMQVSITIKFHCHTCCIGVLNASGSAA
jgi:hypothetical protein